MANMSYCRMHNTLLALRDCEENFEEIESEEELNSAVQLIKLCQEIARRFGEDSDTDDILFQLPDIKEYE